MKILMVGSGAREHAIAKALNKTADVYTYMGRKNPGLARISKNYTVNDESNFNEIIKFAQENNVELAFIGPEAPLEMGIVDELEKEGYLLMYKDGENFDDYVKKLKEFTPKKYSRSEKFLDILRKEI